MWLTCHPMVGVKTNFVTSVEVTAGTANDSPYLPQPVNATAARFDPADVSANKAYLSHANLAAVDAVGAVPSIPFKRNTTGEGPEPWRRMHQHVRFNREEFVKRYHKRSNVETAFSMIEARFGDSLRSKTEAAQPNDLL